MIGALAQNAKAIASSCMVIAGNLLLVTMIVLGSNLV